jgi:hypothetical protein
MDTTETSATKESTMSTETKLQTIADSLNAVPADEPDYNHWPHFEDLCCEHDLEIDHDRQEREDEGAAYEMFVDGGWSLVVSAGEWCVSEPEA